MRRHPADERDFQEQDEERREEDAERTRIAGHQLLVSRVTPSFFNASSGHPFHSGTITLPMYCRSVTPILLDQNPAAVRSRKLLKKATPCANSGFAFCGPRDVVEDGGALLRAAVEEPLVEAVLAFQVDPGQAAAHRRLPVRLVRPVPVRHHEIHELRHAGVGRAARSLVLRDDDVDQHADGGVLVRREELRLERRARPRGRVARPLAPPARRRPPRPPSR